MKKAEYNTPSGKQVKVEIVTQQEIGHKEMSGKPITKDCWRLDVTLDGRPMLFSQLSTAQYQGREVNVLDCGCKIMITDAAYPAVKEVIDTYLTEMYRRLDASYAADKAYDDHCKMMRRAMGE